MSRSPDAIALAVGLAVFVAAALVIAALLEAALPPSGPTMHLVPRHVIVCKGDSSCRTYLEDGL